MIDVYEKKKDPEDGFLYITYSDLEAFGWEFNVYKWKSFITLLVSLNFY